MRGYLDTLLLVSQEWEKALRQKLYENAMDLGFHKSCRKLCYNPWTHWSSNKTANGFQTEQASYHKIMGLIIFEEFGKSRADVITELTDIRSSNEVRISRVSGTITLPATVRMIALSNVKQSGGPPKPIASYPNGISLVTELVPTAEDIARYDIILILADKGATRIDPFWEPQEPFAPEVYHDRIRGCGAEHLNKSL